MGDGALALPTYNPWSQPNFQLPSSSGGIFGAAQTPSLGNVLGSGFGAASGFFPSSYNTTSSGSGSSSATGTTTPNLNPIAQNFLTQLAGLYSGYINGPSNLAGYQSGQANQINATSNAGQDQINQALAARGLAGSPVAAKATALNTINRTNQLNQLNQSIPLLQRQLQGQALQQGNQFFTSIPYGQSTNQNQNYNQQSQQTTTGGGGIGGLLSGIGGIASLFSDEDLKEGGKSMKGADSVKLLQKLKPISFNWKENGEPGHGFSAQQVGKVMPKSVVKDDQGFHRLDMMQMIPHLVSAVNHLASKSGGGSDIKGRSPGSKSGIKTPKLAGAKGIAA